MATMTLDDVVEIVGGLAADGIVVWVDGGWCVDALVGRELREHADLDLAVGRGDEPRLRAWLASRGFSPRATADASAWNYVLADVAGRAVDVHAFAFDEEGRHSWGVAYPAESLTGSATLGGRRVRCIAPQWMFRFKTAYEPAPKDLVDVSALAEVFGYEIPPSHRG